MIKEVPEGIIIPVKVIPKANKNEILDWENGELRIRIAAVPEKGEANEKLIQLMAKHLGIAKSQIKMISGETSRHKRLLVKGLTYEEMVVKDKLV